MRGGRPIRFLALICGSWTLIRIALLWPLFPTIPAVVQAVIPPVAATVLSPARTPGPEPAVPHHPPQRITAAMGSPMPDAARVRVAGSAPVPVAPRVPPPPVVAASTDATAGAIPAPLRPTPIARGPSRFAGSAWLLARGAGGGTVSGGQLGASQAGVRVTYALGESRRLALAARVSAPLSGRGKEAALGIEWRPTRLPLRLIAEQRVALDGGRGGPTVGLIGGFGPSPIAAGFRLETYAQAGAIARDGIEGFVDAAGRVTRPVARLGGVTVDLGAGAWGSAQRGARRFDVGPSLGIVVPVERRAVRLTLDWRQRVAGEARPGSGPALSIGSDF